MARKFKCPDCGKLALTIVKSLDLGADERSDEVAIQCVECTLCGFKALSIYEESRRGASESVNHYGYKIEAAQYQKLSDDIDNQKVSNYKDYHNGDEAIFTML